jgi:hypothetical protein
MVGILKDVADVVSICFSKLRFANQTILINVKLAEIPVDEIFWKLSFPELVRIEIVILIQVHLVPKFAGRY